MKATDLHALPQRYLIVHRRSPDALTHGEKKKAAGESSDSLRPVWYPVADAIRTAGSNQY